MSALLQLMKEMRSHSPAIYVGQTSLPLLAAFLRGCEFSIYRLLPSRNDSVLGEFSDWVQARFQRSDVGWEHLIRSHSTDDAAAVKMFWEFLDQFLKERKESRQGAHPPRASAKEEADSVPMPRRRGKLKRSAG